MSPGGGIETAVDLLLALNVAKSLNDLRPLASVGLHKLKGDRKGEWAMTINGPVANSLGEEAVVRGTVEFYRGVLNERRAIDG